MLTQLQEDLPRKSAKLECVLVFFKDRYGVVEPEGVVTVLVPGVAVLVGSVSTFLPPAVLLRRKNVLCGFVFIRSVKSPRGAGGFA